MWVLKKTVWSSVLALALLPSVCLADPVLADEQDNAWIWPTIGTGKGQWSASVGMFLAKDDVELRNLQLRADVDLAPGVRFHTLVRSDREMELAELDPHFDENYLEGYGFKHTGDGKLSASLRIGTMRYLHFPYPDAIAVFDQVPGISDLENGAKTGYSGELLTLDYEHKSGFGAHVSGLNWDFGRDGDSDILESYVYYRQNFGDFHFETHAGGLAVRPEPLGRRENGYNWYVGTQGKRYDVGILYEKLDNNPAYTGIMVRFPLNHTTKALGKVAFDYDRSPEGFALQLPLASGTIGDVRKTAPENGVLVGEIKAERLRTYWQNGQVRNYYEHRLDTWGETGKPGLIVVMEEEPWYLQAEALVSPHTRLSDLKAWEDDRQGPAQVSQKVTYKFYRIAKK